MTHILKYTPEYISSPDGTKCRVLDHLNITFKLASIGQKTTNSFVSKAKGGETIITKNINGDIEATYVTQYGDAIFTNLHNSGDQYVPAERNGKRLKYDNILSEGYEIIGSPTDNPIQVSKSQEALILHEVVKGPTCIKDAWGKGSHQFLFEGASLKKTNSGVVTGIDKSAFDKTWTLHLPHSSSPLKPPNL